MRNKILLFLLLLIFPLSVYAESNELSEEYQLNLYKAKVIEATKTTKTEDTEIQYLKIKILNRDYKNYETEITNTLTNNGYDIKLKKGDNISVHMELNEDTPSFYFNSYDRSNHLLFLVIFFIICVMILGGLKGIKALISLVITILLILFGLVPLLLKGYNPILLSILTCIISSILTFVITNGFSKKTASAIVGVSGGLLVGGLIAYIFGVFAKITGFSSGNAQMLQYLPNGVNFDFKGLLFAGIIIGSLGACMDVAVSLASSLTEIKNHNPNINNKELIKSGFNIGKDIMGTMVNTLVLAYTGGALASILIFIGFNKGFNEIINLDSIATEIIRSISGSMGLLFAIPFTIFSFVFFSKGGKNEEV